MRKDYRLYFRLLHASRIQMSRACLIRGVGDPEWSPEAVNYRLRAAKMDDLHQGTTGGTQWPDSD